VQLAPSGGRNQSLRLALKSIIPDDFLKSPSLFGRGLEWINPAKVRNVSELDLGARLFRSIRGLYSIAGPAL